MSGLVIKSWKVDFSKPDDDGRYVSIAGRESGLFAWLLALMRIDPVTTLLVGQKRIEFSTVSLAGTQSRLVPLDNICSSYYGYHKPWKAALGIILVLSFFGASLSTHDAWPFIACFLVGIIIAPIYYFLNRKLTLGFVENSGAVVAIVFKRSVIENIDINESQARLVCAHVQDLIEGKLSKA